MFIYRAYPKTSSNLIIAANITTPKYDVSLISYLGDTFLHDSIQLKNLSTTLFFLYSFLSTFIGLPLFFFFRFSFIYWYIGLYSSFPVIFSNLSCIIHSISCHFGRPINRPSYRSFYLKIFKCGYIKC